MQIAILENSEQHTNYEKETGRFDGSRNQRRKWHQNLS